MTSNAAAQSDTDLLRAVIARDADAYLVLYDRYHRLAFGLAYRLLDDPPRAEEAVQDAFMQVWNRAGAFDFDKSGNVRGWMMTIVHHRAIDLHRRHGRHEAQAVSLDDHLELRSRADVWEDVSRTLTQEAMRDAMDTLPEDQRRTIELAYFGGLSQTEIAKQENMPLGTVKGRMRLGLNKLRTVLANFDQEQVTGDKQGFS
ncbi:MAG: sigma-70 family RNA polymerase sigma factor [Chloroflexia bacterium]|nr:sigma-70 family RNA polymerase sigma factor [Chloroflexia bacterium]